MSPFHLLKTCALLLFLSLSAEAASVWNRSWDSVDELVIVLETVPSGRTLWREALKRDPELRQKIRRARSSFTESTYIRSFRVDDAMGAVSLRHDIYLGEKLTLGEAVLDLAHELHHYLNRQVADPYNPSLKEEEFIRNGIEGPGGELEAFEVECGVAWDLTVRYDGFPDHPLCGRYRVGEKGFHREQARRDYYAVGTALPGLVTKLSKASDLPLLSSSGVVFRSGHAGVAYPLALVREFADTLNAACRNNDRKARMIASHGGRAPASLQKALQQEQKIILDFQRQRCSSKYSADQGRPR